jgi:hypothetical protein
MPSENTISMAVRDSKFVVRIRNSILCLIYGSVPQAQGREMSLTQDLGVKKSQLNFQNQRSYICFPCPYISIATSRPRSRSVGLNFQVLSFSCHVIKHFPYRDVELSTVWVAFSQRLPNLVHKYFPLFHYINPFPKYLEAPTPTLAGDRRRRAR